jgi:hypothetical protein
MASKSNPWLAFLAGRLVGVDLLLTKVEFAVNWR